MIRTLAILVGFVVLLGAGVAVAAWPRDASAPTAGFSGTAQLLAAYGRVVPGIPASKLGALGFDTGRARRLSALALTERFMPADSFGFDALDPALRDCLGGPGDCVAYVFDAAQARGEAVLLVQRGRVAWKSLSGVGVAAARHARLAAY